MGAANLCDVGQLNDFAILILAFLYLAERGRTV
jgi:hypothetical protein